MDHEAAERLISERMDGERLSARQAAGLDTHLASCARCRAFERGAWRLREAGRFELAPTVPDLVEPIMARVELEPIRRPARLRPVRPHGRSRRPVLLPRLAPAIAALLVGALAGSLLVGGPWREREREGTALAAADVTRAVTAAASSLEAYHARFVITEYHLSPYVPVRELSMRVWFRAPERFRLDIVDETDYPSAATPTSLRLIVNGSTWYSKGPAPCPTAACPQREAVVRNRAPYSRAAPMPVDLVLPLTALGDAEGVTVVGGDQALGRPAVVVELPFERAAPLFPFLHLGGTWRPFFANDRVRVWLDQTSWFPLRWEVYPAGGTARDQWALRFGLPEEPSRRAIFVVDALAVDLSPPGAEVFEIPDAARAKDQGALPVSLSELGEEAGFEPLMPAEVGGLDLYQAALPMPDAGSPAETLLAYAQGLAFVKVGETRDWTGVSPFGPVGIHAEEVVLPGGGLAYYEPATGGLGRRLSIHAAGTDLYLESNLPRRALLEIAGSLPVTGLAMPEAWTVRETRGGVVERVTIEEAVAEIPFPLEVPALLPEGFALASAELVRLGASEGVTLYFQHAETSALGSIRFHLEAADELPPAAAADRLAVEVRGAEGRYLPEVSRLEWIEEGVYRSIDAPGLDLERLVAIASSIPAASPEGS